MPSVQFAQKKNKPTRLKCERCSQFFKSAATLKYHMEVCSNRNSEPRFTCTLCQKRFRTDIQYARHLYYSHSERRFVCTEAGCGRTFTSQSHLSTHMMTHSSDRPHACPVSGCSYRARTIGRLVQHKAVHGEGRRFSCDYCDYRATTSSNLRRHARIHAGARPYLCPHCDHRTSELDALKKHVLDSGRHPGLPFYVCPWCKPEDITDPSVACIGFNASSLAWRHLMSQHPREVAQLKQERHISQYSEQRDVTRLLGIYCPEIDSTKPPVGSAVRQPAVISPHRLSKQTNGVKTKFRPRSMSRLSTGRSRLREAIGEQIDPPEIIEDPKENRLLSDLTDPAVLLMQDREAVDPSPTTAALSCSLIQNAPTVKSSSDCEHLLSPEQPYTLVQIGSGALWFRRSPNTCQTFNTDALPILL